MPVPPLSHIPSRIPALLASIRERRARTAADRHLTERLREAFEVGNDSSIQGLSFYVCDGAVSVYGSVQSSAERDVVVGTLARIPDVRRITEYLTLKD